LDREQILAEIRRCAASNGGKPLGRERFTAVTGVREHEWLGKYWARWSDAIREAGLEPNEFQVAYDDGDLLRSVADLARSLGHFPTSAELRLARRNEPSFPSEGAISRLGNKAVLARRVSAFCFEQSGYDDVIAICSEVVQTSAALPAAGTEAALGVVYLMKSGAHYKIGRTNALGRREYELAIQLPERLELVHSFETDDPAGIERYWHERFADRRANGEWFTLTANDLAAFKRRKRFM
jgi:hypothetical protein